MEQKFNNFFNIAYLLSMFIMIFFFMSSISVYGNISDSILTTTIVGICFLVVFFSLILFGLEKEKILVYILFIILTLSYLYVKFISRNQYVGYDWTILYYLSFYIGLRKSNKSFFFNSWVTKIGIFLAIILLCAINFLPNIAVTRWGEQQIRWTMGFSSPNTLGTVFLAIVVESIYLLKKKEKKFFILLLIFLFMLTIFFYIKTDSRTSMLLSGTLILVVGLLFLFKKNIYISNLTSVVSIFSVYATALILPFLYSVNSVVMKLNNLFSGRIVMAKYFFNQYGASILGSSIPEKSDKLLNYNYYLKNEKWVLDNAYFRILLNQGYLFFIVLFVFFISRMLKKNYNVLTFILIIAVFAFGMFERYAFNIFLFPLLFLDNLDMNDEELIQNES